MTRYRPAYVLETVKQLAQEGKLFLTSRPMHFILNRYDGEDAAEIAAAVVEAIREEDFYKSIELDNRPGTFADIYRNVECEDYPENSWYVKLFVCDGETMVEIWSMVWEGYTH